MSNTHKWNKNDYPKCQSTLHASLYKTQLQNVYTLSRHSNWETLLKQIKKDNPTESSIIFYGNRMNGWQKEKLVQALVDKLNTSVSYRFEEKYDALILSYRKKG
jgi:hypothetical protein